MLPFGAVFTELFFIMYLGAFEAIIILSFFVRLAAFAKFGGPHYGSTSSITSLAFWPSSNTLDLRCQWKKSGKTDGWLLGAGDPADYLCRDFHCVRAQDHVHG